jgi:hypothetical protein
MKNKESQHRLKMTHTSFEKYVDTSIAQMLYEWESLLHRFITKTDIFGMVSNKLICFLWMNWLERLSNLQVFNFLIVSAFSKLYSFKLTDILLEFHKGSEEENSS